VVLAHVQLKQCPVGEVEPAQWAGGDEGDRHDVLLMPTGSACWCSFWLAGSWLAGAGRVVPVEVALVDAGELAAWCVPPLQ
jgi:hypothetical protein